MREGWTRARLGDVADVRGGSTPSTKSPEFWGGGVPWVTPSEITRQEGGRVTTTDRTLTEAGLQKCGGTLLPAGTVLLTSRATVGAVAQAGVPLVTNQGFAALVPGPEVLSEFLMIWCQQNRHEFTSRAGGSTFPEISRKVVKEIPIEYPDLAAQRRVVDLLGAARGVLDGAREVHRLASVARAAAEHSACGVARGAPSVPLGDVADVAGGITKDRKKQLAEDLVEVPYLRVANVQRGFLNLTEVSTIRASREKVRRLALRPGDILLNEGGDRDKLGRGWVWEGQISDCIHQNHVFRARLTDPESWDPKFVSMWANTFGSHWFYVNGGQTSGIASISINRLKQFPIPCLPVEQQRAVVALSDSFRAVEQAALVEAEATDTLLAQVRHELMSGVHEIPLTYDAVLEGL